jgi:hypothetical protein
VCENLLAVWQPRVYYAVIPKTWFFRESMKFPALLCMFGSLVDSPAALKLCARLFSGKRTRRVVEAVTKAPPCGAGAA